MNVIWQRCSVDCSRIHPHVQRSSFLFLLFTALTLHHWLSEKKRSHGARADQKKKLRVIDSLITALRKFLNFTKAVLCDRLQSTSECLLRCTPHVLQNYFFIQSIMLVQLLSTFFKSCFTEPHFMFAYCHIPCSCYRFNISSTCWVLQRNENEWKGT